MYRLEPIGRSNMKATIAALALGLGLASAEASDANPLVA